MIERFPDSFRPLIHAGGERGEIPGLPGVGGAARLLEALPQIDLREVHLRGDVIHDGVRHSAHLRPSETSLRVERPA